MRDRGFTLVELMVALMIFAMIAAAGVALLGGSVNAQAASGARLSEAAAVQRLSSLLAADLGQATARITRNEAGDPIPAFSGTGGASGGPMLTFVRAGWSNAEDAPRASLQKVAWRIVDGRLERLGYAMLDGAAPPDPAMLLDGVEAVTLRYRTEEGWIERWQAEDARELPRAVEITLRRSGQGDLRMLFLVGRGA